MGHTQSTICSNLLTALCIPRLGSLSVSIAHVVDHDGGDVDGVAGAAFSGISADAKKVSASQVAAGVRGFFI